jgi:hypothetical protein
MRGKGFFGRGGRGGRGGARARQPVTSGELPAGQSQRRKSPLTIDFSGKLDRTPTKYWGAVYSLTGERVGTGWVGDGHDHVVVARGAPPAWPPTRRVFIGAAQDWWGLGSGERWNNRAEEMASARVGKGKGKASDSLSVRAFIGKKSSLFAPLATPSQHLPPISPGLPSMPDPLTGPDIVEHQELSGIDEGGGDYTMQPWSAADPYFGQPDSWNVHDGPMLYESSFAVSLDEVDVEKAILAGLGAL